MSDVFFDNIFTDYRFHQQIQRAGMDLRRALGELQHVVGQSQQHLENLTRQGRDRGNALESARGDLERTRRNIMEGAGGLAPPTYTAPGPDPNAPPAAGPAPAYHQ